MVTLSFVFELLEQVGIITNLSVIAFFALLFLLKYYIRIKGINMKGAAVVLMGNFAAIYLVIFALEALQIQGFVKSIFSGLSLTVFPLMSLKIYFMYYLKRAQVDAKNLLKLSFKTFGLLSVIFFVGNYIFSFLFYSSIPIFDFGQLSRMAKAVIMVLAQVPIYALGFLIPFYISKKSLKEQGLEQTYALKLSLLWFALMLGFLFVFVISF